MSKRIAVFGAGAVGGYIGACLAREGYEPTLIDMWAEHVEVMRDKGLSVTEADDKFTVPVNALHISDGQQIKHKFDIIFLAVKSYDTEWACHYIKQLLAPDGVVVNAQNCMNDQLTASIVGHTRQIGCVMTGITVAVWEPGHVSRGILAGRDPGLVVFRVGESHGKITPRAEEIADMLSCIDGATTTTNVWGQRWWKLMSNVSTNAAQATTGLGSRELGQHPRARLVQVQLAKEAAQIGVAQNYDVLPVKGFPLETWANADQSEAFEQLDAKFNLPPGKGPDWPGSMSQDIQKGRKPEVEYMNGFVVEQGRISGIPTPVNAAVVEVANDVGSGALEVGLDNIERILTKAGL